eukprot:scaffold1957_cov110-Isochrysis_galbana.AAC.12
MLCGPNGKGRWPPSSSSAAGGHEELPALSALAPAAGERASVVGRTSVGAAEHPLILSRCGGRVATRGETGYHMDGGFLFLLGIPPSLES